MNRFLIRTNNLCAFLTESKLYIVPLYSSVRTAFWSRKEEKDDEDDMDSVVKTIVKQGKVSPESRVHGLKYLRNKSSIRTEKVKYVPPVDVEDQIKTVMIECIGSAGDDFTSHCFGSNAEKFKILVKCMENLHKYIPNSYMNDMKSMADVVKFFNTEVKDKAPVEDMASLDLPKNLHIQVDYKLFDEEDGVPHYPKQDVIMRSIKDKKLYKDFISKKHWYDYKNNLPPKDVPIFGRPDD